jgi:hypothetical protein
MTVIDGHSKERIGYAMADPPPRRRPGHGRQKTLVRRRRGLSFRPAGHLTSRGPYRGVSRRRGRRDAGLGVKERAGEPHVAPREHARTGVTRYGDVRHDTHGLHSTPGYRTPREAHSDRTDPRTAA